MSRHTYFSRSTAVQCIIWKYICILYSLHSTGHSIIHILYIINKTIGKQNYVSIGYKRPVSSSITGAKVNCFSDYFPFHFFPREHSFIGSELPSVGRLVGRSVKISMLLSEHWFDNNPYMPLKFWMHCILQTVSLGLPSQLTDLCKFIPEISVVTLSVRQNRGMKQNSLSSWTRIFARQFRCLTRQY